MQERSPGQELRIDAWKELAYWPFTSVVIVSTRHGSRRLNAGEFESSGRSLGIPVRSALALDLASHSRAVLVHDERAHAAVNGTRPWRTLSRCESDQHKYLAAASV